MEKFYDLLSLLGRPVPALHMLERQALIGFFDGITHGARNFTKNGEDDRLHPVSILKGLSTFGAGLLHDLWRIITLFF